MADQVLEVSGSVENPRTARSPRARGLLVALCTLAVGCTLGGGSDGYGPDGGAGGGSLPFGGGSVGGDGSGGGGSGGGTSQASSEICDGIDNDGDGVIDNIDKDGDGVCDCLRIATLGYSGEWGTGDVFSQWLKGKSFQGATALEGTVLTADVLASFHVIVVQDVREGSPGTSGIGHGIGRTYSADEIEALKQWVSKGGGLMTLTGYADSSELTNVNSLLAPFGLSYGTNSILFGGGGQTAAVTHWATHPLTEGVSKVGVDNGYPVLGGGTLIAWEPNVDESNVARAVPFELGHVFAWGDEWITYDSEWTQHTDYQVGRFWLNSLKWLPPGDFCQVAIPDIG